MEFAIILLVFSAVFFLFQAMFLAGEKGSSDDRFTRGRDRKKVGISGFSGPVVSCFASFNDRRFSNTNRYLISIRNRLKHSGNLQRYTPSEFIAIQEIFFILSAVFAFLLVLFSDFMKLSNMPGIILLLMISGVTGAVFPLLPIDGEINKRRVEIFRMWPFFIDLLIISIQAGMSFTLAVERIIYCLPLNHPLANELIQFLNEIKLGQRRSEALVSLGERIDIPSIRSAVSVIVQAEELGTPLAPLLSVQVNEFRTQKAHKVEKKALEAPVKMLLPLIGCIFPAILIILLGPVLIQYMGAGV